VISACDAGGATSELLYQQYTFKATRLLSVAVSLLGADVLMCSCAHVLMCSCAHVLMCSCTHVRLIVCAFVGVQNTCICTVHLCKYSCKLIVVELWAAGARSRTCKNETPFYTRLYEPGIVMSRLTHNIEHFYGEFSI
jgi:hypothetical protein